MQEWKIKVEFRVRASHFEEAREAAKRRMKGDYDVLPFSCEAIRPSPVEEIRSSMSAVELNREEADFLINYVNSRVRR